MTCHKLSFAALFALAFAIVPGLSIAQAGDHDRFHEGNRVQVQIPHVNPHIQPVTPRLGIYAIERHGQVEVQSTSYGTPAARMGLERGDRILRINGHRVDCLFDIRRLLQDAVEHHYGKVTLVVDNVRGRHGYPGAQRIVTVRTFLDGFGHHHGHDHGHVGPVQAY